MARFKNAKTTKAQQYVRWCNVYFEIAGGRAIVATCFNHAGLLAEMPNGSTVVTGQAMSVGEAALRALGGCRFEPDFNYRSTKPSEWPAFQASGERSVAQFERTWRCVTVRGANEFNASWELTAQAGREFSLRLTAFVAPTSDAERLGEALLYVNAEAARFVGE